MGLKSSLIYPYALWIARTIRQMATHAVRDQQRIMQQLVSAGAHTAFGKDHHLGGVRTYEDYKRAVPIRDYEDLKEYIERARTGEKDILWFGKPLYFAKTSGTTSGVKYIPMSKESTPLHFSTARNAAFNYFAKTGNGAWLDGKVIFLSGSPEMEEVNGIKVGRLSGISNHLVPAWLKTNQMPSWSTNCIEDWETKVDRIVEETLQEDMRLISGIPPWVQMYYERLLESTGKKTILDIFPNFSVFIYGGVNFEPYRARLEALVGKPIDSVETFPASEGFVAFQDCFPSEGLLLNTNAGLFFEFVPVEEFGQPDPRRLWLAEVELHKNYVLIINSNAGLWGYNIGDTVQFVSLNPYRLVVSGRIKHFISAFGEHVIAKEVEEALLVVAHKHALQLVEFTVAPQINPSEGGLPYHEWLIEFADPPTHLDDLAIELDLEMRQQNIYYDDLIQGGILRSLKITALPAQAFREYMKTQGKLGGQNKVPRLSNDRKIADALLIDDSFLDS